MNNVYIKANFASDGPRFEVLEKREVGVFPLIMINEGVHCGSAGCVLYPADELAKFPGAWDHKPVVVRHPSNPDGTPTSACKPSVANTTKIGTLFNTRFEDGKLKSEAWVFKDACQTTFPDIWQKLLSNQMQEVSTGLFFETEEKAGKWGEEDYTMVALNIRPDHLAILPDEKGACSIEDGAGIPRINKDTENTKDDKHNKIRANQTNLADVSYDQLYKEVRNALDGKYKEKYVYIEELFLDYVVYSVDEDSKSVFYKCSFSTTVNPFSVELKEPVAVERVVTYKPIENKDNPKLNKKESTDMEKETVEEKKEEEKVQDNAVEAPKSIEELLKVVSSELGDEIKEALNVRQAQKDALVANLLAVPTNPFSKDELEKRSIDELNKLTALASKPEKEEKPVDNKEEKTVTNYSVVGPGKKPEVKIVPLVAPVMNWEKKD